MNDVFFLHSTLIYLATNRIIVLSTFSVELFVSCVLTRPYIYFIFEFLSLLVATTTIALLIAFSFLSFFNILATRALLYQLFPSICCRY